MILSLPVKNAHFEKGKLFVTQRFGENYDLYMTNFGIPGHNGLDFDGIYGDPIVASHDGVARVIWDSEHSTRGNGVYITTNDFQTIYWHLSDISVSIGQNVKRGQQIGRMGNSGFVLPKPNWTNASPIDDYYGTHLHYGLRPLPIQNNKFNGYIDPWEYLTVNTKTMLSIYGNSATKEQYVKDDFGTLHRIANTETLLDLHEAEIINKDGVVWLNSNEFAVYKIGNVWLSYSDL